MPKIKELLNFEKIKDVIDIDSSYDKQKMVENYVISQSMEEYLVSILNDFQKDTHKAVQVIGGYGSGKSHLLAFVISLLTDKSLRHSIQNEKVREAAENISRNFVVIRWELQPNDVELAAYFYDRIEQQLEESYGIQYEFPKKEVVDHKKMINDVVQAVKAQDPTRGLAVVVDEISDFLKQKDKEKITRDVQFLRILGQVAQETDFTFIGAMQEHIFTNPKYVDEAESFGRVSERFQIITIKREDIKKVIAKRVLNKTREQRIELEKLFSDYTKYYPAIQARLNEFIDLFPLHPYVVQIFSELPYFEKRGVIQFTIQEVEKVLDKEFPHLITYDLIYDEIESKHTVKNLDTVSPVVDAVQTLGSKIDLLEEKRQKTATEVIKALGVLKLYGKSTNNGANAQELANTLLILPSNKMLEAEDEISLVLDELRKVTDGQFINRTKEGYYFLDFQLNIDYDQVIKRKADNLPENALDDEILGILKDQLILGEETGFGIFRDTCQWKSRKSFREGQFVYETGKGDTAAIEGDYQVVFISPFCALKRYRTEKNRLLIFGKLPPDAFEQLKMLASAKALINDNYQRSIIQKKYASLKKEFTRLLATVYLENGNVEIGDTKKSIKSLVAREFSNFDELFSEIKPEMFDSYFNDNYRKHPKFSNSITRDNIKGEFSTAVKNLVSQNGAQTTLFSGSKSILNALELLDEKGNTSTAGSEVAQKIRDAAKENAGQNLPVAEFVSEFRKPPYGYDPIMTEFVMAALTYTGEIALKAAGGKTIGSSEVVDVFKSSIDAFENIKYLTLESEFDKQPVIKLFMAVGLDQGTARKVLESSKRNAAIQEFRKSYLEIKEKFDDAKQKLEKLSLQYSSIVDIEGLNTRQETLKRIPFSDFEPVKTPNDLKKIIYPDSEIEAIGKAVVILGRLHTFYKKFFEEVEPELDYVLEAKKVIDEYPDIFQIEGVEGFIQDSFAILSDAEKLLSPEDFNPLLGKLQSILKKYKSTYYHAHEKNVGSKVDWTKLSRVTDSLTYHKLRKLKNVELLNKRKFIEVENQIAALNGLKCPSFKADILDKNVVCTRCGFPKGFKNENPDFQISLLDEKVRSIYEDWENTLLAELENHRGNLQYLSPDERTLIEAIIRSSHLPEYIDDSLVIALNNLFRELEIVEVTPTLFLEAVFKESQVMDYRNFDERIKKIMQKLVAGKDLSKVRIKLAQQE
jgi:KaiC/GvpD/RAD55 family RecA-like ATPase